MRETVETHPKLAEDTGASVDKGVLRFYSELDRGVLTGSVCRRCKAIAAPPSPVCTKCYGRELDVVRLSGRGVLTTYTRVHVAPPEFQSLAPYTVAVVHLDEGPSLLGMIAPGRETQISQGGRVEVDFETSRSITPGKVRLVFRPIP